MDDRQRMTLLMKVSRQVQHQLREQLGEDRFFSELIGGDAAEERVGLATHAVLKQMLSEGCHIDAWCMRRLGVVLPECIPDDALVSKLDDASFTKDSQGDDVLVPQCAIEFIDAPDVGTIDAYRQDLAEAIFHNCTLRLVQAVGTEEAYRIRDSDRDDDAKVWAKRMFAELRQAHSEGVTLDAGVLRALWLVVSSNVPDEAVVTKFIEVQDEARGFVVTAEFERASPDAQPMQTGLFGDMKDGVS